MSRPRRPPTIAGQRIPKELRDMAMKISMKEKVSLVEAYRRLAKRFRRVY